MGGIALRAYMRLEWEASAWLGWPGLAGLPLLSDIFLFQKKVIRSTIEKEAREKEKDKPNTIVEYCKQLIRVGQRYRILQINSIVLPGFVFNYL
jgi:hypothetical protein